MTLPKLAGIRARLEAATPGPWRHVPGDSWCAYPHVVIAEDGTRHLAFEDHSTDECAGPHCEGKRCGFPSSENNAEFIAHAPEDIRALLDCVGVLWAALENVDGYFNKNWAMGLDEPRTALSDARKILGSEQEGGAG